VGEKGPILPDGKIISGEDKRTRYRLPTIALLRGNSFLFLEPPGMDL